MKIDEASFALKFFHPSRGFLHLRKPRKTISKDILLVTRDIFEVTIKLINEKPPLENSLHRKGLEGKIFMVGVDNDTQAHEHLTI